MDDHTKLLEALRQRDVAKSEKLAVDHVAEAGRLMVEYLSTQGYWNIDNDEEGVDSKAPSTRGPQEMQMNENDHLARLPEVPTLASPARC